MEFFLIVLGFSIGWAMGSIYTNYLHIKHIRKIAEERGMDLEQMARMANESAHKTIPILIAEKQNEVIYLYDNQNNFVSQGSTFEELAKKTLEYNKINVALVHDGDKEFWFYQGELKQKEPV